MKNPIDAAIELFKNSDAGVIKEVNDKMKDVQYETSLRQARYMEDRQFYNGEESEFWKGITKAPGKYKDVFNYPKVIVDKYAAMLSTPIYDFECPVDDVEEEEERNAADLREKTIREVQDRNHWKAVFRKGAVSGSLFGNTYFKVYIVGKGEDREIVIKHIDIPDNVYIGYASNDYDEVEWCAYKYRLSKKKIEQLYNKKVDAGDMGDIAGLESKSQTMVSVIDYWDIDKNVIIAGNTVLKNEKNDYGFIPFIHIPNISTPGNPFGTNDIDIVKDVITSYGQALCDQGDLLDSFVNPKIKAKNMPRVPASWFSKSSNTNAQVFPLRKDQDIDYLQWGGNIWPMKEHLQELKENLYRLSSLPAVAFGEQIGSVITGFGLSIQYHATIQKVTFKRGNWDKGLRQLHSYILRLTEIIDPKAKEYIKEQYDTKVIWPEVLPKDSSTHILNTTNKLNAGIISLETAMKDSSVQSPTDEKKMLIQERTDERLFPDKSVQYLNAQMELLNLQQQMKAMKKQEEAEARGEVPPGGQAMAGGQTPEMQGEAGPALAPEMNQAETGAGLPITQAGMEGNMAQGVEGATIKSPNLNKQI